MNIDFATIDFIEEDFDNRSFNKDFIKSKNTRWCNSCEACTKWDNTGKDYFCRECDYPLFSVLV